MTNCSTAAATIRDWCAAQHDPHHSLQALALTDPVVQAIDTIARAANAEDPEQSAAGIKAVFADLVEHWNDRFSVQGRLCYGAVFGRIVWQSLLSNGRALAALKRFGIESADDLIARWSRVRANNQPLPASEQVHRIVVLSRVTIGADILLTSVVLQRLRAAYPQAKLVVVGDGKLQGLLGGIDGVHIENVKYARRGPLHQRLSAWLEILEHVDALSPDLVISPDSRLDQLGLLPLIDDARYRLWENTQPGEQARSLADMVDAWLQHLLPQTNAQLICPHISFPRPQREQQKRLRDALGTRPIAAVKLDHGGNPDKALPEAGVTKILETLRARGWRILLDRGFGADELAESDALVQRMGWEVVDVDDSGRPELGVAIDDLAIGALSTVEVVRFHGSIAGWAAAVSCCQMALSYDSVGHHLAAALDVPVVVAFTGHSHADFPVAWAPRGNGPIDVVVIPPEEKINQPNGRRCATALWRPIDAYLDSSWIISISAYRCGGGPAYSRLFIRRLATLSLATHHERPVGFRRNGVMDCPSRLPSWPE